MNIIKSSKIFWGFCRPHTLIGTSLQVITAYCLASERMSIFSQNLHLLLLVWMSSVAVNIYVVGLNQLIDINIDRVNKPFLPLAAQKLSKTNGWIISLFMGLFALVSSYLQGMYLFSTISAVLFIGSIYSLPSIYLKGNPLGAALAISLARGLISNLGVFLHFRSIMTGVIHIPFSIIAFALFNFCFAIVIALMKDTPDLIGDKLYGVRTLAVRIGVKSVFHLALSILTFAYLELTLAAIYSFSFRSALILALLHSVILAFAWLRASLLRFDNQGSIYSYYMLLWKFFYIEFGLFSFVYCIQI